MVNTKELEGLKILLDDYDAQIATTKRMNDLYIERVLPAEAHIYCVKLAALMCGRDVIRQNIRDLEDGARLWKNAKKDSDLDDTVNPPQGRTCHDCKSQNECLSFNSRRRTRCPFQEE